MKNYTSLGVMKASEVVPTFTEEKVTEETFEKEKQQGTLYKGFEIPKNAKMLKFRYYSPDGTLIEQNNVPIVYDGTGIKSVQTYYLLTNEKSGITLQSDGWDEEVQTVTAEKRFLWTYIKTTYTNNVYTCTDPCISSVFGEQGERGAVYLGHYADNQTAYSENTPAIFTGDYYLNLTDSYLYVYNKEENVWAKISDFSDYRYNQSMNDIFESLEDSTQVENFMKIKVAWIQRLSASMARLEQLYSNTIKLVQGTDLNGNTTGGVIQSENFVSGSTGWKIDYNGNAEFANGTFRGTFNNFYIKNDTSKNVRLDFYNKDLIGENNISIGNQNLISLAKYTINNIDYLPKNNVSIGSNNLKKVISGEDNIAIGQNCGNEVTIEDCNTFIGSNCGSSSNAGSKNVAVGYDSFAKTEDARAGGSFGTYIGTCAGAGCRGDGNTCVGYRSGYNSQAINSVFIGDTPGTVGDKQPDGCIAIGNYATINTNSSSTTHPVGKIAIGQSSVSGHDYAIAIGRNAKATGYTSVAIGDNTKTTYQNEININNQFRVIYFQPGTTHSVIYNYFVKYFYRNDTTNAEGCVMGYYGSYCISYIKNDNDGNLDFYSPGSDNRLVIRKDSSNTISDALKIGFLTCEYYTSAS